MNSKYFLLACSLVLCLNACGASPQAQAAQTAAAASATAGAWTPTPNATATPLSTPTLTPTPTLSPTPVGLISAENCQNIRQIRQVGDGVLNMLVYSPDGRWLAVATSNGLTLYDAAALKPVWSVKTAANLTQIAFAGQGETLSGVDISFQLYQWQVSDGKQLLARVPDDINELPMAFALSPDGSMLAAPAYDDSIHLYRMSDASLSGKIEQFLSLGEFIASLAISPDAKRMVSISLNGDIRLWSITDKKLRAVLPFDKRLRPYDLIFAPDGKLVVDFDNSDGQKSARVLDVQSHTWGQTLEEEITAIAADKTMLSLSGAGIDLYKFGSNLVTQTLPEQAPVQARIASSPDGAFLAVGTNQGIHIWARGTAALAGTIQGRYPNYSIMAVSADGAKLAAGSGPAVEILNSADGSVLRTLAAQGKNGNIQVLAFAPGGDLVAAALDKTVFAWQVETGSLLWSARTKYPVNDLAFSADGSTLAGVYTQPKIAIEETTPGQITLWNANSGQVTNQLEGGQQILMPGYSDLAFSADGLNLIAGQGGGDIEIWLVEDWSLSTTISTKSFMGWSPQIAVSPDGKTVASGGMDRQIQIWKVLDGSLVRTIKSDKSSIEALAYSADGKMIAAGALNDIELWNADTGGSLCKLTGSGEAPIGIFFTPDRRSIISLTKDGIVRIWGLP